ncbi:MAG: hypothetical protein ACLUL2_07440 [Blautia sp.]
MGNSMEKSSSLQQENVHRIALTKEQQKNFSRQLKRGICRGTPCAESADR